MIGRTNFSNCEIVKEISLKQIEENHWQSQTISTSSSFRGALAE